MRFLPSPARVPAGLILVLCILSLAGCGILGLGEHKAEIPETPPRNSLVVFDFAPAGDADAGYYGCGFARALSDRLDSTGSTLVLLQSPYSTDAPLYRQERALGPKLSDEQALKITRTLGARYAAVGNLALFGDDVKIAVRLLDTQSSDGAKTLDASGRLDDLPGMQISLARELVSAMGLRPDRKQKAALGKANFTRPEALLHAAKGLLSSDAGTAEAELWRAYDADPGSLFVASRLIDEYADPWSPHQRPLRRDTRITKLVGQLGSRHPDDPDVITGLSCILARQYKYGAAEESLRDALKIAPDSLRAHSFLTRIAMHRQNTDLAVEEARKAVSLWPSNPIVHSVLAEAFSMSAAAVRRQHDPSRLTEAQRRRWERDSYAALEEANAAVKAYPGCKRAWFVLMERNQDIGRPIDARKAFDELVRLNPTDGRVYAGYISGIVRTRGSVVEAERAMALSDQNLSYQDAYAVRGWAVMSSSPDKNQLADVVRMADKALSLPGEQKMAPLELKCRALTHLGDAHKVLAVATKGYAEDPSPRWRQLLAYGLLTRWQKERDRKALNQATKLCADYVREIPYDPFGHMQLADCYMNLGESEKAASGFERALELDPGNETAARRLREARHSRQ